MKFKKIRTMLIITLITLFLVMDFIFFFQLFVLKTNIGVTFLIFLFGCLPSGIFLFMTLRYIKSFIYIKKIAIYYFIFFLIFMSMIAGGIRSMSLLCFFIIPFLAFLLEEEIFLPSIITISYYTFLVIAWSIPVLDNFFLKMNIFPPESFLIPSVNFIIFYYVVQITIFIASYAINIQTIKAEKIIFDYNKELIEAKKNIENLSNLKIDFFIKLAHETKTPLTLILNSLEQYIKKHGMDDDLRIMQQNSKLLSKNILSFIDAEKSNRFDGLKLNDNEIFLISNMLENKADNFAMVAKNKNIEVNKLIEKNVYIKADHSAIDKILNNLIDNAIKYTNKKGKVNIELKTENDEIIIKVSDNGIGISEEQQKQIFNPYYQVSSYKENNNGIGMGLFISKSLVEKIGGKISFESKIDSGTTFKVSFKKHNLQKTDNVISDYESFLITDDYFEIDFEEKEPVQGKVNILSVEDNVAMLKYISDILSKSYNVFTAFNGKEALEKIDNIPDLKLIISDVMMDEMNGFDFLDEIKKDDKYSHIPFVFLSAKDDTETKISGYQKGVIDYIAKPFSEDVLSAKIDSIILFQSNNEKKELVIDIAKCKEFRLSNNEIKIIELIKQGMENKEIGNTLGNTESSIKTYISMIFNKVNVHNRIELINKLFS
jgi:signal transduction histidine kinase/DNA-binding NarL/FixJ family response regulator